MSNIRKMKVEISVGYECDESAMRGIQSGLINRVEGMLQLGDFDFLDEEGNVKYAPHGWEVNVLVEDLPTHPIRVVPTDDDR